MNDPIESNPAGPEEEGADGAIRPALRPGRHRRQAQRGQVDAAERPGRPEDQHHLAQGADHAAPHHRHAHAGRHAVRIRRHAGLPDPARQRAEPFAQQDGGGRGVGRGPDPVRGRSRQLHAGGRASAEAAGLGHPDGADRQQAGQHPPPGRHRAMAADHAGEACLRRVRADVGQELEGHRAAVRHLRKIPAGASLVVRRRRAHRPQRDSSSPAKWCARSCSASPATNSPTPRP